MIIVFFTKRTGLSRLTIALAHFVILNLLLGSMSCDDDSPTTCYVTKITAGNSYINFTYDDLDRITFAEFKRSLCPAATAEVIWEDDRVRKIIYTQPTEYFCDRPTTREITILYANNLVTKIGGDYEFTYNNDLSLSEVIYLRSTVETLQYNSDRNVLSTKTISSTAEYTIEYSYDKTFPNYLSPMVKALGNQPALVYFLLSRVYLSVNFLGVTALSL